MLYVEPKIEESQFLQISHLYKAFFQNYNCKLIVLLGMVEAGIYIYYAGTNYALDIIGWGYG